jgi:hypothetical protein
MTRNRNNTQYFTLSLPSPIEGEGNVEGRCPGTLTRSLRSGQALPSLFKGEGNVEGRYPGGMQP